MATAPSGQVVTQGQRIVGSTRKGSARRRCKTCANAASRAFRERRPAMRNHDESPGCRRHRRMSHPENLRACFRRHCVALPPAHDEERGRFEVFEPPASVGLMHVTVAPETEGPQVTIGLTSQSFVGGMVQVDALIRSACRAPSRQAGEVLALSLLPLRRLEVSAVLGTVPGHGPRSCRSPHPVLRTSTNDANQRRLTTNRKP